MVALEMGAIPVGAAETNGATRTSPSTRSFFCRPSEQGSEAINNLNFRGSLCRSHGIFLCFSCQFVVSDDQDYKAHFTDPDTLVNWDCVQQVVSICSAQRENSLFFSTKCLINLSQAVNIKLCAMKVHVDKPFLSVNSVSIAMRCHLAPSASTLPWLPASPGVDTSFAGHACCTTCLLVTRAGPSAPSATRPCTPVTWRGKDGGVEDFWLTLRWKIADNTSH